MSLQKYDTIPYTAALGGLILCLPPNSKTSQQQGKRLATFPAHFLACVYVLRKVHKYPLDVTFMGFYSNIFHVVASLVRPINAIAYRSPLLKLRSGCIVA
jgi:hypothetical protein